jgi:hypothetical protein
VNSTPSPAAIAARLNGPGPGRPRGSPGAGSTTRPGPRGAARRRAASRKVTEPGGVPGADSEWAWAVSASAATTSCVCAHGPSASSTSSGAAAPASQAEDHTVNVAEAQGTTSG